jgi:glycosyltransferase involved in cell wall biosynthesis
VRSHRAKVVRGLQSVLADGIDGLPQSFRDLLLWRGRPPQNAWHSFDRTPWNHPWLSRDHLCAMKEFSAEMRTAAMERIERIPRTERSGGFGFVGNMANGMYIRAKALRRAGLSIDVIGASGDNFAMSQPGWEEFDGEISEDSLVSAHGRAELPAINGFFTLAPMGDWAIMRFREFPDFVHLSDYLRWRPYLGYLPTLKRLQPYAALLTAQVPYLAYLSGRPYLATQVGGDIWYECARDDVLGRLQRLGFHHASAFLVSNPWSFAHARRYGMRHLIYVPFILDQDTYCPGEATAREQWRAQSGGDFFVLSTARVDEFYKGSSIGLEGFAAFSRQHPGARLVQMGWGADFAGMQRKLTDLGIGDRAILLPTSGKRRVISYLRSADCLLDQFRLGYFGATALEAMACGLPVVMRLERGQYDALCETGAPPVLDASTPGEVCAQLTRLGGDSEWHAAARHEHREWFLQNHGSARWWKDYFALLLLTARGHRFRFDRSPLHEPLSAEEREYHAVELANAPTFPNYQ